MGESGDYSAETPRVRTRIRDDELPSDAVLRAADDADVDLDSRGPLLYDYLDVDALNRLLSVARSQSENGECTVEISLWGRPFVITPTVVEVYDPE
jgi:hypothetical protein